MTIAFEQLMPIPLKDRLQHRRSDIWSTSLVLQQGDRVKIKAPSGSGKTTLVHIIYKLRYDYEGIVQFDNLSTKELQGDALAEIRQQKLSVIFQDLRLFPNLTGRENIELNRVLQIPYYNSDIIDMMADRLGVTHVLEQNAAICSYGEQQRLAIIRSLIQPFSWLLMDEPFSHLDKENTRRAASLIEEECTKRNAGFLITDLDEDDHFSYTKHYQL